MSEPQHQPNSSLTALTRKRYQRIAPFYDLMEILAERGYHPWRQRLWSLARGTKILEVGVGTGKNMPYYPASGQITAIDLTPGMLERAGEKARKLGLNPDLRVGDVQALDFPPDSFDTVVATFVFCSVPNPELGLREIWRVLKPGGYALFLDHVRSGIPVMSVLMDFLNPLVVRLVGANINRRTVETIRQSPLSVLETINLGAGNIFKMIIAQKENNHI